MAFTSSELISFQVQVNWTLNNGVLWLKVSIVRALSNQKLCVSCLNDNVNRFSDILCYWNFHLRICASTIENTFSQQIRDYQFARKTKIAYPIQSQTRFVCSPSSCFVCVRVSVCVCMNCSNIKFRLATNLYFYRQQKAYYYWNCAWCYCDI